jgi:alpha-glucosidase
MTAPSLALLVLLALPDQDNPTPTTLNLDSPNARIHATVRLDPDGRPTLAIATSGRDVAHASLGLDLAGQPPLGPGLEILSSERTDHDQTYPVPVGKTALARDHHHQLLVELRETSPPHRRLHLILRAFDDAVAFRYHLPDQPALSPTLVLTDELTRWSFPGDPTARLLPLKNYTTSYENLYESRRISEIPPGPLVGLPILMQDQAGSSPVWMAITEADLTDYAGMYLAPDPTAPGSLLSRLSPLPARSDGAKVLGKTPFSSPWRVVLVADDPGRLIESNVVFHLNPPCALADTTWIHPGKTTFPWWNGYALKGVDFTPGVNTATMKHYIDFCADHGIPYHSLDGLDIAWYGGPIAPNGPTDVTKAAPSINMPELLQYARDRGVQLRVWVHWLALKPQLDQAFATYEQWGLEGVMVDFMDRDDQDMVRFYHEMARKAAEHHLTLTLHGAYKPTGMERTWPNVLTYEAVLNQEYNKWPGPPPAGPGTPPRHNLDAAFVRMLAGPLDYHQGGMRNVLPAQYQPRNLAPPVQGTRGHQMAMYVVYQNHLPMLADSPDAYRGQPGLDFLTQVPCTWDETRVLLARPGHVLVIARRKGDDWYLGGMTADEPQSLDLPLDFLPDQPVRARLYLDNPHVGPTAIYTRETQLQRDGRLHVEIPPSGGFAARLSPDGN